MIILKSEEEIEKIRISSQIAGSILSELEMAVKAGIKTIQLEELAVSLFKKHESGAAFLGYNGFPAHICVSVNDTVVHGIPGNYCLREGDIVSIDVGVLKNGYYGDVAGTFPVGKISKEDEKLIQITRKSLYAGIENARVGNRLFDISHVIEKIVTDAGFSVVRDFVGHGIGQEMHEDPQIPNFGGPHTGPILKQGMVLAIEPMVNVGTYKVFVEKDKWTVRTRDHKKSAHFEHTVAILKDGPCILSAVGNKLIV
jgi:methionyl aminopeptidase